MEMLRVRCRRLRNRVMAHIMSSGTGSTSKSAKPSPVCSGLGGWSPKSCTAKTTVCSAPSLHGQFNRQFQRELKSQLWTYWLAGVLHGCKVTKHALWGCFETFICIIAAWRIVSHISWCASICSRHLSAQHFRLVQRQRHVPLHLVSRHLKSLLCGSNCTLQHHAATCFWTLTKRGEAWEQECTSIQGGLRAQQQGDVVCKEK